MTSAKPKSKKFIECDLFAVKGNPHTYCAIDDKICEYGLDALKCPKVVGK